MKKIMILGCPNVGKSSLFNRLVKQKKALVLNHPGLTRDILKQKAAWWGKTFEVWDSGGLWSKHPIWGQMVDKQVQKFLNLCDLVLWVVDGRQGLSFEDKNIFRLIKKSGRPFLILVNKLDEQKKDDFFLSEFFKLGQNLLPCAFESGRGVPEIVEWIISQLSGLSSGKGTLGSSVKPADRETENIFRILVAGKVNAGKSTFCNQILRSPLLLTSKHEGTTVDTVEHVFRYNNKSYILCDTAGIKKTTKNKPESLARFKTMQAFESSHLVLLLADSMQGPLRKEANILRTCLQLKKPVIFIYNKWDLIKPPSLNAKQSKVKSTAGGSKKALPLKSVYRDKVEQQYPFFPHLPVMFTDSLKGEGIGQVLKKMEGMRKKMETRISTSRLNTFLKKVITKTPPPKHGTQDVKFYYLTQVSTSPPHFMLFVNFPKSVTHSYLKFLTKQIQKEWGLLSIPVKITLKARR